MDPIAAVFLGVLAVGVGATIYIATRKSRSELPPEALQELRERHEAMLREQQNDTRDK